MPPSLHPHLSAPHLCGPPLPAPSPLCLHPASLHRHPGTPHPWTSIPGPPSSCPRPHIPIPGSPIPGPHPGQAPGAGERQDGVSGGPSHLLGCSGAGRDPAAGVLSVGPAGGARLCPAVSFPWQCLAAEPGFASPRAVQGGSRWVPRAIRRRPPGWHPAPGTPRHAATCSHPWRRRGDSSRGEAGTSTPCQHLRLPPPGSPLSPLTSLAAGCSARQMAPICRGARARALVPSAPAAVPGRPCQTSARSLQMEEQAFPRAAPFRQPPHKYLSAGWRGD